MSRHTRQPEHTNKINVNADNITHLICALRHYEYWKKKLKNLNDNNYVTWTYIAERISELQKNGKISAQNCRALFSEVRQFMEGLGLSERYPNLNFFCNLSIHSNLNHKNNLIPLQHIIKLLNIDKYRYNSPIDTDGFMRVNDFKYEFEDLIENYFSSLLRISDESIREIYVSMMESVAGKKISPKNSYRPGGTVNVEALKKNNLCWNGKCAISSHIEKRVSLSDLEVFYIRIDLYRVHENDNIYLIAPIHIGRCQKCQSSDVLATEAPYQFRCRNCGSFHTREIKGKKRV